MDSDDKLFVLEEELDKFRNWSYASLAAEIERRRLAPDCLAHIEGVFADGTEYQMEFNVFWDGKPGSDLRVCGDLTSIYNQPLVLAGGGFMPDVSTDFIMRPDGSFVGE
jgi:hypothetical protein